MWRLGRAIGAKTVFCRVGFVVWDWGDVSCGWEGDGHVVAAMRNAFAVCRS